MKKHRYKSSFLLAALIYVGFFLLYLYMIQQRVTMTSEDPQKDAIELSLSQFVLQAPPSETIAPVQQEQLLEEEPESESEPEKAEEEPVLEERVPDPDPEPVVKEKPVITPVVKKVSSKPKQKVVKKRQVKKKHFRKKHAKRKKPRKKRQVCGGGSPRYSAAQRNRFLALIRQKIDRAKFYPRIAQRRGMQGMVKVRFTILSNGHVSNIVLSGPKVFYASARKAVKSAFPVDVKKATLSLPTTVNLSLRYRIH
ncbi:MAG: TonB family protein [Sulfurovum sp.]|nr:TonB family protein [Sulfurovum sp.]